MKHIVLALGLTLAPPVLAEGTGTSDMKEGASLLEEGARLFLRGLMSEMEPELGEMAEKMQEFAESAGPAMREMMSLMDDISNYHPPEILPNGDIIIRRKTPAEIAADPGSEVEL